MRAMSEMPRFDPRSFSLEPLARQEGFPSYEQMVRSLRFGPFRDLHRKVVEAMTNNETSFFRDVHPFEHLRQTLLPELLTDAGYETAAVYFTTLS